MKKQVLSIILSFVVMICCAQETIKLNTEASSLKWIGSKIYESHEGTIKIKSGYLTIKDNRLAGGEFVIDMTTIENTDMQDRRKEKLESHLKNEDFFDVVNHKNSSLKIKKVEWIEDTHYKLSADLMIKGITNEIMFVADVKIKKSAFLAIAKIKIDRTKWDIKYKSGSFFEDLGDRAILDEIVLDVFLLSDK